MIQIQLLDISSDDILIDKCSRFIITLYGKTNINNDGFNKNIVCHIEGYTPYFYLKYPNHWTNSDIKNIFLGKRYLNIEHLIHDKKNSVICGSYEFYGYHHENDKEKQYKFIKLEFINHENMKKSIKIIKEYCKKYYDNIDIKNEDEKKRVTAFINLCKENECYRFDSNLYESNIHPILRFIHEYNIKTCGWIQIENEKEINPEDKRFNVDLEYKYLNIKKSKIKSIDIKDINKFIIASFDIECDSSHGDFPNPVKDLRKLCIDIVDYFKSNDYIIDCDDNNLIINNVKDCITNSMNDNDEYINKLYLENGPISDKSIADILNKNMEKICELLKNSNKSSILREKCVKDLNKLLCYLKNESGDKIVVIGDPVIQIGVVFHRYGDIEPYDRSIVVMGPRNDMDKSEICDDLENINVYRCQDEKELLLKWKDLILKHNPDYITGYNIFGFDFDYIIKRVSVLFKCVNCKSKFNWFTKQPEITHHINCESHAFFRLGRLMKYPENDYFENIDLDDETITSKKVNGSEYFKYKEKKCNTVIKRLGNQKEDDNDFAQNTLKYIHMDGRIIFDVQNEVKKNTSLDSYKLDNVAAHFVRGKIISKERFKNLSTWLSTNNVGNLKEGDYISISITTKYGDMKYNNGEKFIIMDIGKKGIKIKGILNYEKIYGDNFVKAEWCLNKDDVSPQELFRLHKEGGPDGRAKVAKYCIMDCELCIQLLLLLDFIPNNMGMSNVCYVPQTFIFLRGQGIKVQSIVTKICSENNIRLPTLKQFKEDESDNSGFEGAIVLEPETGIYLDDPIAVLDYASLYPTSIKEKNLSHDTYYGEYEEVKDKLDQLGWTEKEDYNRIKYKDYVYETKLGTSVIEKKPVMKNDIHVEIDCVFLTDKRKKGIIPKVVSELLAARSATKKLLAQEKNEDKKKVLDGYQLAYKLTANSVYGQLGAKTSSICFKKVAACTTAIGRERIYDASRLVMNWAEDNGKLPPEVIYGDTDSIFVKFSRNVNGETLKDKDALAYCIKCGIDSGKYITEHLHLEDKKPQDLEYEKTFWPFILISKKRYTGDKYEFSAEKVPERTSMGLVTKRRDNAPIVKYVFGNLINKLIYDRNLYTTVDWLKYILNKICEGNEDMSMFILSKTLNSYYKNPDSMAHKVLADRIGDRDPGNKPKANDRIPYAFIEVDDKPIFMGNKMITKKVNTGERKMITKKVNTGKRKMITKDIPNGFTKSGEPKTKKAKVPEGEPIFKNERVPEGEFIYKNVTVDEGEPKYKKKIVLQGDRIEHPDYIKQNNIKLDYKYYISNQIMNPVKQVLDITMSSEDSKKIFETYIR